MMLAAPTQPKRFSGPVQIGDQGMVNMMMPMQPNDGYDGGGINPGGGPINPTGPYPPAPVTPPAGPMPTIPPGNTPAPAPVPAPAQSLGPTAEHPLAPLNSYQAQQRQGSYQAPAFQGQASYQAGSYNVPQVSAPSIPGYDAQSATAPTINAGSYQAGNTQAGQVGAQNASAGRFDVEAFRPFSDAVYSEASRQLDPQFASQEAAFRQRMVNQGIQEGTPAFDNAYANFERSRNDAYSSARNQALAQALGAQNQFFGQNLANSQMGLQASMANASNALQAAGLNQSDRQFGAQFGLQGQMANADNAYRFAGLNQADRQFGAGLGMQGQQMALQAALANAGFNMQGQQMAQQDRQFGATQRFGYDQLANAFNQQNAQFGSNMGLQYDQMGQQDRQFGANYDFGQSRADMQDLMALLGYGQQTTQYNNALLGQDQQRAGSLFGLIPGLTPTQLDVMGPANLSMQAQNANNANATNAQNGLYSALGQIGASAMMLSDRRAKTDISRVGKLDNGLNVYAYRYKSGGPMQIGVMAQEVAEVNPSAVANIGGLLHVNYAEAVR